MTITHLGFAIALASLFLGFFPLPAVGPHRTRMVRMGAVGIAVVAVAGFMLVDRVTETTSTGSGPPEASGATESRQADVVLLRSLLQPDETRSALIGGEMVPPTPVLTMSGLGCAGDEAAWTADLESRFATLSATVALADTVDPTMRARVAVAVDQREVITRVLEVGTQQLFEVNLSGGAQLEFAFEALTHTGNNCSEAEYQIHLVKGELT